MSVSEATERRDAMHMAMMVLIVSTLILTVFGVIMVYSATAPSSISQQVATGEGSLFSTANNQLLFAVMGWALCLIAALFPMRFYQRMAPVFLILGLGLQALIFTSLSVSVAGNTNWVSFAGIQIQPSEFLKLALIVFLARDLAGLRDDVDAWWKYFLWWAPAALGAVGLVVGGGGDLGTGLVYVLIVVGMFWLAGGRGIYIAGLLGLGVLGVAAMVAARPARLVRITQWLGSLIPLPDAVDPTQVDFALWAFGSGGIAGTGLGTGTEKWPGNLAEAQTDFIFAVVGEEFGLGGCLVIIITFVALAWALVHIARHHPSRFAKLFVSGVAMWLCGQALANMLVVTGVVPVFGVPLPFISQGGSSLVAALLAIGVSLSCALHVEGVRDTLRVRRPLARRAQAVMSGGRDE